MSNATLYRKWKPGWDTTYEWGLNTPPAPTLAAGARLKKTIDDFEDLTDWSFTGGGAGGALAADTDHKRSTGSQSMKLTCTANEKLIAVRPISLDLSKFVVVDDLGISYIMLSYYTSNLTAIDSIIIKLSCADDGGFDKDYYQITLSLGGYPYATLGSGGALSGLYSSILTLPAAAPLPTYYTHPTEAPTPPVYTLQPDGTYRLMTTDEMAVFSQTIPIPTKSKDISSSSLSWTDLKLPVSDFIRMGDTVGHDWSTITAISIELHAISVDAEISFDDWQMVGGGNLFGYYWVAVSYENELANYGPYTDFVGPVELDAQPLVINGLIPDTDIQTVKRRLVILGGSITQPMVTFLNDNTSTSLTYNELDNSLTITETNFNNRKPPACIDMKEIIGRIFMVIGTNTLIFSEPLMYEAFPLKNYLTLAGGEKLYQVDLMQGGYVAARGYGQEYLTQLTGSSPSYWQTVKGAKEGAVSSRLLIEDPTGVHIFMSKRGFYTGTGEYLPKINPVITEHSSAIGDISSDRAYIYFKDSDGIDRIMRIDYRLGKAVAHYVEDIKPSAIFADSILDKVYYALDNEIYEFDAGTEKLAAKLTIPEQLCGVVGLKSFESLNYELADADLSMVFTLDRVVQANTYALPAATRDANPLSLPPMVGGQLGFILTSDEDTDFTIYLPWDLQQVRV